MARTRATTGSTPGASSESGPRASFGAGPKASSASLLRASPGAKRRPGIGWPGSQQDFSDQALESFLLLRIT